MRDNKSTSSCGKYVLQPVWIHAGNGHKQLRLPVNCSFLPQQLLHPAESWTNARLHGTHSFPRKFYVARHHRKTVAYSKKIPPPLSSEDHFWLRKGYPRPWACKHAGRWVREHCFIQLQPGLHHPLPVKQLEYFFILFYHPSSFSRVQAAGSTTEKLSVTLPMETCV